MFLASKRNLLIPILIWHHPCQLSDALSSVTLYLTFSKARLGKALFREAPYKCSGVQNLSYLNVSTFVRNLA